MPVMPKLYRALAVIAVSVLIALALVTFKPQAERQDPTETVPLVEVITVTPERQQMAVEAYGTIQPRETVSLVAEVHGRIVNMNPEFQEGNLIPKGEVILEIDPRTYRLELERRQVQLQQSEAELRHLYQEILNLNASLKLANSDVQLAETDYNRIKSLAERNVTAQTTLEKAQQRYLGALERVQQLKNQLALVGPLIDQAKANRDMATVMVRQARLDLEKTQIRSPFDGYVLEKKVEEGQIVNAGAHLGGTYRAGAFDVSVHIPAEDFKWLDALTPRGPHQAEARIVYDGKGVRHAWEGRVTRVKAQMDAKTRTFPVVVELNAETGPEAAGPFPPLPGMFVTVVIQGTEIAEVFALPRHVLRTGEQIYVLENDRLRIRDVSILRNFKDQVFVSQGLHAGDLVITTPLSGVYDGLPVRARTS